MVHLQMLECLYGVDAPVKT